MDAWVSNCLLCRFPGSFIYLFVCFFNTTLLNTSLGILRWESSCFYAVFTPDSGLVFSSVLTERSYSTTFPASTILLLMSPLPFCVSLSENKNLFSVFSVGVWRKTEVYLLHLISSALSLPIDLTSFTDLPSSTLRFYIVYISAREERSDTDFSECLVYIVLMDD